MFRHVTTRLSGLVILIAGIWGGLIPFLGPYFHFTLGPDHAWTWTTGRLWLSVIPAAVAVLGGLILMGGGPRLSGRFGALMALAAGAWFAIGPDVSMLWNHGVSQAGAAHGRHTVTRMLEYLTLHTGLGVLIVAFAAYALPGAATYAYGRRRVQRDAEMAGTGAAVGAAEAHHRDRVSARQGAVAAGTAETAGAGTAETAGAGTAETAGAGTATATEPVATREEPVAGRETNGLANGNSPAQPAGTAYGNTGSQPAYEEPAPRRRGGLAGLFSRR